MLIVLLNIFLLFHCPFFSLILFCLFSFHRLWQLLFKNPSRHSLNFIIKCINVFYHMSFKSCSLLIFYFRYFFTCHHSIFLSLSLFSNFPLFAVFFFIFCPHLPPPVHRHSLRFLPCSQDALILHNNCHYKLHLIHEVHHHVSLL